MQAPLLDLHRAAMKTSAGITAGVSDEKDGTILQVAYREETGGGPLPDQFTATVDFPFRLPAESQAQGISLEVKGDGSRWYASVMLGYGESGEVACGYEAIFPLESKDWTRVTLGWDSFVQNHLPWDSRNISNDTKPLIEPARIGRIGFGLGHYFHRHYPREAAFQIRNISLCDSVLAPNLNGFSTGWSHTQELLGRGQKLRILLIGDSITQLGENESYGHLVGEKIRAKWGNAYEVANCGIGGHSARAGAIILPRSLRTMPNPDLVFILFGANDVKELGSKSDFGEAAFRTNLERLIDKVRAATGGSADICLINGIPRLLPDLSGTAGSVETIVEGVKVAAATKQTAFVDSFRIYLSLPPGGRWLYYRDTIHPTPEGQVFLGGIIFDALLAEIGQPGTRLSSSRSPSTSS